MPAFSSSLLKRSFDVIVAISERALRHWSTLPQIDVRTEMTKVLLIVIAALPSLGLVM
jgi:cytochrome P450